MKIYAVVEEISFTDKHLDLREVEQVLSLHTTQLAAERALTRACNEEGEYYMMTFETED